MQLHHLSYSSLTTYASCGKKYELTRKLGAPEATWFATLAGSAFHSVTEEYDRRDWLGIPMPQEDTVDLWVAEFEKNIRKVEASGREIKASGRQLKTGTSWGGGPNKKDKAWWLEYGPKMLGRFFNWRNANGYRLAEIDGKPGIEVPFMVDLIDADGVALPVQGVIDRVYQKRLSKDFTVLDLKTGSPPQSTLQLETYALALSVEYGISAAFGAFWSPGSRQEDEEGIVRGPFPLHSDLDVLSEIYHSARRGIEADIYVPNTNNYCSSCGVSQYCLAWSGVDGAKKAADLAAGNPQPNNSLPGNRKDADDESHD